MLALPYINPEIHNQRYTYWESRGRHQHLLDQLNERVPASGSVINPHRNPALERFRKAQNCYYDLYNNNLCNRARSFSRIFKMRVNEYMVHYVHRNGRPVKRSHPSNEMFRITEPRMDAIILAAAHEQGILA